MYLTCKQQEISGDADLLQYGSSLGDPDYRTNVAKFLSSHYQDSVDPESIFTTCGATIGLSILVSIFFNAGDVIFVEDPTFFRVNQIVRGYGLTVVPIPLVDDGIEVEMLEKEVKGKRPLDFQPTDQRPFWACMYLMTVYHNPTGICYSKEKCKALIRLARDNNILIICDDVYNLLCFEKNGNAFKRAPPRLFQYDVKADDDYFGNVVSNGSFSKVLAPGLRLGWFEAPKVVINQLLLDGRIQGGGSMNHYTSGIVASSLNTDLFSDHLLMVRSRGKEKLDAILGVFRERCPEGVKFSIPTGGYFMWIELPGSVDIPELHECCLKNHNISFHHGVKCSVPGRCQNCIRICFMYYSAAELVTAATKLLEEIEVRLTAVKNVDKADTN
ncbi:2-aminoadipate transaminase-like isoform X2 [Antedon mediterranea]|uniref:2-aminoadipate transaminase-like isoform X2 n=1 Tax=Antedon mediterranea TaxID=105859 RepID=UPI003AF9654F